MDLEKTTTRYCDDFSYVNAFRTLFLKKIARILRLDLAKDLIPKRLSSNRKNSKKIAHFFQGDAASIRRIFFGSRFARLVPLGAPKKGPFWFGDGARQLNFKNAGKDVQQASRQLEDRYRTEWL